MKAWTLDEIKETMKTHTNPSTLEGFRRKYYCGKGAADLEVAEGAREFIAKITTNAIDRDKEIVRPEGIDFSNFTANPVILWAHDYDEPAIGKAQWIKRWKENGKFKGHISKGVIAKDIAKAEDIFKLIQQEVLRTFSIGFVPIKGHEPTEDEIKKDSSLKNVRYIHDTISMLEYSIVNVPSNPEATMLAVSKGQLEIPISLQKDMGIFVPASDRIIAEQREQARKNALPYKQTTIDGIESGWQLEFEKNAATVEELLEMCAWYDGDKPESKSSYKFLHHRANHGNPLVFAGVAQAMSRLNNFITIIPEEDRMAVWKHLAKHFREFGKEPPELKDRALSFGLHEFALKEFRTHESIKTIQPIEIVDIKIIEPVSITSVESPSDVILAEATETFEVNCLGRV